MNMNGGGGGGGGRGGRGPCGACKYLRRKCVRGCVFAPYFDAEQGTGRFAAVHKVFGASNTSKMLLRLPSHKRLDAVVTLCYEAFARLRDPVYGPLSHILSLQHQVVNLQAELAYVQARLSTSQRFPLQSQSLPPPPHPSDSPASLLRPSASSDTPHASFPLAPNSRHLRDPLIFNPSEDDDLGFVEDGGDLQELAMQLVSSYNYFPAVKLPASTSS